MVSSNYEGGDQAGEAHAGDDHVGDQDGGYDYEGGSWYLLNGLPKDKWRQ